MTTPEAQMVLAAAASIATFSLALSTPPSSRTRYAAVAVLAALQPTFARASGQFSEHGDIPYGTMTLTLTLFWHAVDYLLVVRATSRGGGKKSPLRQYVSTPLALLCNWRRLGTEWRISQVPLFSRRDPAYVPSRLALIGWRLLYAGAAFVVIDLSGVASTDMSGMMDRRALFSRLGEVTASEALLRAWLLASYTVNAMAGVYLVYASITVVALALCLSSPAECPPMFGSVLDAYSVRRCWGSFYHQGLRRAVGGPAGALVDALGLPRHTAAARYAKLLAAFAISAVIHGWGEAAAGVPPSERGHALFFIGNALAIMFEEAVQGLYRRLGSPLPVLAERAVGYLWVLGCMFWLGPHLVYSAINFAEPRPSQLRPLLASYTR